MKTKKIGLFVENTNLMAGTRQAHGPDGRVDFRGLLDFARAKGELVVATAYIAHALQIGYQFGLYEALRQYGYELRLRDIKPTPDGGKCDFDAEIGFALAEAVVKHRLSAVTLCTGDGDYLPILEVLIHRGVEVTVVAPDMGTSRELALKVPRFHSLSELGLVYFMERENERLSPAAPITAPAPHGNGNAAATLPS